MTTEQKIFLKDNTEIKIRNALKRDLTAINDIYNHYVSHSTCTYQMKPESMEDRRAWFDEHGRDYPVIVAENNDLILGWAAISPYRKREAYKPTVENSIYVRHDAIRRGIGTLLLREVIARAKETGYHSILAGISAEQEVSIILHEKHGFSRVACLKEVGYKFDKWLDVVYFQLLL